MGGKCNKRTKLCFLVLGCKVGLVLGCVVGFILGCKVGLKLGSRVGKLVCKVGLVLGCVVGFILGCEVGLMLMYLVLMQSIHLALSCKYSKNVIAKFVLG